MLIIKLLTLNTHSLIENNYKTKLKIFTDAILQEKPDIIALQEVNQTINCTPVPENEPTGFYPCQSSFRITKDNHAYHIIKRSFLCFPLKQCQQKEPHSSRPLGISA